MANISIVSADGTVTPIYSGQNVSVNVQESCGSPTSTFAQGPVALDSVASSLSTKYYVADHLGTARMEFAAGGWPMWSEDFAPYGQEVNPQPTDTYFKFAGLERDPEGGSNLDHAQFRQYASAMGRWSSPDPYDGSMDLTNPQTLNRYAYVGNQPLNSVDPSGLDGDTPSQGCFFCGFLPFGIGGNGPVITWLPASQSLN